MIRFVEGTAILVESTGGLKNLVENVNRESQAI